MVELVIGLLFIITTEVTVDTIFLITCTFNLGKLLFFLTQKTGSVEKQNMFSVFLSTELLNFVVRLLWIRIPNESLGTNDQPWHASHGKQHGGSSSGLL